MSEGTIGTSPHSHRGYVGLALESNYGDGPDPEIFVDAMSDGFELDNQVEYDDDTTRSRGKHKGEMGPLSDEGSVDFPANPENGIGLVLLAALGAEDFTTEEDGDVGVHTFYPSDTLPSLAVEVDRDLDVVRHVGTGVDELELAHTSEELLTWSSDMVAKEPDGSVESSSPTYSDLRNFWFHDADLTIAGTDRTADLQDITPSIANDLEGVYRGSRSIGKMQVGNRTIQFEATLDFETRDLFEAFLGEVGAESPQPTQDPIELAASWTSPETINGTSTQYSLDVDAPKCVLETHNANIDGSDLVAEEVTVTALVDPSLGYECEFTLKNGITEAY